MFMPADSLKPSTRPVSIAFVVAAYNVADYLDGCLRAIDSVVQPQDEVIIVNDGSQDSTGVLADQWCAKAGLSSRWRVIHQSNRGLSAVRRVGMRAASSDYVLFADGDDEIEPEALHPLRRVLDQHRPDILVTDHWNWTPDSHPSLVRSKARSHAPWQMLMDVDQNLLETFEDGVPCVWGRVFSRDLLLAQDAFIFPEWSMYDDTPSTPYLVRAAKSIWYEPLPVIKYRNNPGGLTKVHSVKSCMDLAGVSVHAAAALDGMADPRLQQAAARYLLRKLRDNVRMLKRTQAPTFDLRLKVLAQYVNHVRGRPFIWRGVWALLKTHRFGDVKALVSGLWNLCLVYPVMSRLYRFNAAGEAA
jgi:glycosyltransferase involved in cell wall biosynthesis